MTLLPDLSALRTTFCARADQEGRGGQGERQAVVKPARAVKQRGVVHDEHQAAKGPSEPMNISSPGTEAVTRVIAVSRVAARAINHGVATAETPRITTSSTVYGWRRSHSTRLNTTVYDAAAGGSRAEWAIRRERPVKRSGPPPRPPVGAAGQGTRRDHKGRDDRRDHHRVPRRHAPS